MSTQKPKLQLKNIIIADEKGNIISHEKLCSNDLVRIVTRVGTPEQEVYSALFLDYSVVDDRPFLHFDIAGARSKVQKVFNAFGHPISLFDSDRFPNPINIKVMARDGKEVFSLLSDFVEERDKLQRQLDIIRKNYIYQGRCLGITGLD